MAAAALAWSFLIPLQAQNARSGNASEKTGPAAQACEQSPRNALWRLAQSCARDLQSEPTCRVHAQDQVAEYVIVKDRNTYMKPANYLMIPVRCVTGIEDNQIFSPAGADLWEEAWLWSRKYPGAPASRTALAINSAKGRGQDQLHIHISCVRPEVAGALAGKEIPAYPAKAAALRLQPNDYPYYAVKVKGLAGENSPFKVMLGMLGRGDSHAVKDGDLQDQSIAVIGSEKANEFYVLVTTAGGENDGHAEELLDQTCR